MKFSIAPTGAKHQRLALDAGNPSGVVIHWIEPTRKQRTDEAKLASKRNAIDGQALNDALADIAVVGWERMSAEAFRELLPHKVTPDAAGNLAAALAAASAEQIEPGDEIEIDSDSGGRESLSAKACLRKHSSDWRARVAVLLNVPGEVAAAEDALRKKEPSSLPSTGA